MKKTLLLLIILTTLSCSNNKSKTKPTSEIEQKPNSYTTKGYELLYNEEFLIWDSNAKPTHWKINETVLNPENHVVERAEIDLLLNGHASEKIFISQELKLKPNTDYLVEALVETNVKHYSDSGITVSQDFPVGKIIFNAAALKTYKLAFKTNDSSKPVSVSVGFNKPEEGTIMIKSVSVREVNLDFSYYESEVAQYFQKKLSLNFSNEKDLDKSVETLSKFLSDLLLSRLRKDSVNVQNAQILIPKLKNYTNENNYFLKRDLQVMPVEMITHSFVDKQVFGLQQVLKEFNVGASRIDFLYENNRIHMMLKYFNPYSKEWKYLDPFYNARIFKADGLNNLSDSEFELLSLGGLVNSKERLKELYSKVTLIYDRETLMSLPF